MERLHLNPHAVAIMLALRPHRESVRNLHRRIGDPDDADRHSSTEAMCRELVRFGLITRQTEYTDLYLTEDGIAWLESWGLKAEYVP